MTQPSPRAAELVQQLQLQPHPEGGHYAEVHRAAATVHLPDGRGPRSALTSIYFLLCEGDISRWHRVLSDEVWVHLEGAPIELHQLDGDARLLNTFVLGPVSGRSLPQCTVPAGLWQAARSTGAYSLAACMVGPGFEFADFSLMTPTATEHNLLRAWLAQHHTELLRFC